MNNTPDYYRATNTAYQLLTEFEYFQLPVDIAYLASLCPSLILTTYAQMAERFSLPFGECLQLVTSDYGFTMRKGKAAYIVYNTTTKDVATSRFTIAHELGHYLLDHRRDTDKENREANCFARNILCPIPMARQLGLDSAEEYARYFQVSLPMAEATWNMKGSDSYYIEPALREKLQQMIARCINGATHTNLFDQEHVGYTPVHTRVSAANQKKKARKQPSPKTSAQTEEEYQRTLIKLEEQWLYEF